MPSWLEILVFLPFISETTAVFGLVITSMLIVLLSDWRLSILALLVQYVLANVLLLHCIHAELVLFKFIVGAMLCPILFMSARRVYKDTRTMRQSRWKGGVRVWTSHEVFGVGLPFRFLAVVLVGLIGYSLLQHFTLAALPLYLNFAVYWLGLMGLLTMMLSGRPLKVGLGLLTFMTAFELYYVTVEKGLVTTGLLGVLHLMTALVLAYLISVQTPLTERGMLEG